MIAAIRACARALAGISAGLVLLCLSAHADPTVVKQGSAVLPTSGLSLDLPARAGFVYHVSGSWSFDPAKNAFDTRDIIDEIDAASGNIAAGNWILVGYFDAGGCDEVLAAAAFDAPWTSEEDVWGMHWKIRGGVFTFANALGRRPAAALCNSSASGRSLLLYRYLTDQPETLDKSSTLQRVRSSAVLERASAAYRAEATAQTIPLRRADVKNRGTASAQRKIALAKSGLQLQLPDDGYFWLPQKDGKSDMINRLLPSLPEAFVEVFTLDNTKCAEALSQLENNKPSQQAQNLPVGWIAGPTLVVDGEPEMVLCRAASYGALLVGVLNGAKADVSEFHPMLEALAQASRAP